MERQVGETGKTRRLIGNKSNGDYPCWYVGGKRVKIIAQRSIPAGKWSVTGWWAERPPLMMTTGLLTLLDDDRVLMTLFENVLMTLFDDKRCLMTTEFYDSI